MRLNKKAVASIIYMLIIGLLLFIIISVAISNGFIKAFKSYKGSEQSFSDLTTALSDVSNKDNNLALQLVRLEMEENTALFIFIKDSDLLLSFEAEPNSGGKMLIEKPVECSYSEQCVCLCKDFKLKSLYTGKNADELNEKYGKYNVAPAYMYSAECGKGMECTVKNDFAIPNRLTLREVMNDVDIERIEQTATQLNKGRAQNYIYLWENGFVLWRLSTSAQKDKTMAIFQPDQFMTTKYLDLYVVNNNVNVKICLDPECRTAPTY